MGFNLVCWSKYDVGGSPLALPPGDAGGIVLVGVSDTAIMFFFEFVLFGIRGRVAALPEGFYELVALLVVRELLEGGSLFVGNDPAHVLVQPLPVRLAQFDFERFGIGLPLFVGNLAFEWVGFGSLGGRPFGGGRSVLAFVFVIIFVL